MNAEVFVDTNVLLYTIDEDPATNEKRERAQQILLTVPSRQHGRSRVDGRAPEEQHGLALTAVDGSSVGESPPPGPGKTALLSRHARRGPGV